MICAGFDIGGTNVRAALIDDGATPVAGSVKVPNPQTPHGLVDLIVDTVARLTEDAGRAPERVGVAIAGLVTPEGVLRYSPNIPEVRELAMADQLTERLGLPAVVHNDANAALWAETCLGAARGEEHVVGVGLGTGIGSGLVLGGRLYTGAHGFAGETGHMVVDAGGELHRTGARGPWERYGSGAALGRAFERTMGIVDDPRDDATIHRLVAEADPVAMEILDGYAHWVALGVANIVHVFDPAVVVLFGGVAELGEPLRRAVEVHASQLLVGAGHRPDVPVVIGELGDDAGVVGAALLAAGVEHT